MWKETEKGGFEAGEFLPPLVFHNKGKLAVVAGLVGPARAIEDMIGACAGVGECDRHLEAVFGKGEVAERYFFAVLEEIDVRVAGEDKIEIQHDGLGSGG